ncbi:uncharacterized protein PHALS_14747 [Plasmopara halstedii]|uniref:Uncharacterized protein n=1 Tax=Plasmopara halstedii TaxID=4781 RepID=A0A0P1AWJ8_PLAHL|nr:uncharacterized protein PHALS_14747 [Plasmopara halstedii]CEG45114.1 hypothetical protein PHALS_14747 [Plasmopara halstedii]|eukprot:XP_024581483.1 hypothetical protein PHALS_14747 [Plasmopara halstedii]
MFSAAQEQILVESQKTLTYRTNGSGRDELSIAIQSKASLSWVLLTIFRQKIHELRACKLFWNYALDSSRLPYRAQESKYGF